MAKTAELLLDCKLNLGEGPIWDNETNQLYWVNIMDNQVMIYDPATNHNRVIDVGQHVGTVVPGKPGTLYLALHHGFASLDLRSEAVDVLVDPEEDKPGNRFNDGKCDPAGRFWAGTMPIDHSGPKGALYVLDTDGSVRSMVENVSISNGIVWSLDSSTMYFIDTPSGRVDAFDYELETGNIGNRRTVITFPEGQGMPDGMTGDTDGMLWIAHFGGGRVTHWDPGTGQLLDTIHVPASQVTACAFGGPDLDQMYITTARINLDDDALRKEPLAGGLFTCKPGAQGLPADRYGG